MRLSIFLRIAAFLYIPTGILHFALGTRAEALVGAVLSGDTAGNAAVDSQLRFYAVSFSLSALLVWIIASDLKRFGPILNWTLLALFVGGIARLFSAVMMGWPPPFMIFFLCVELLLPPVLFVWHSKTAATKTEGASHGKT